MHFNLNKANEGAHIFLIDSNSTISNSTFYNGTADLQGSAIKVQC